MVAAKLPKLESIQAIAYIALVVFFSCSLFFNTQLDTQIAYSDPVPNSKFFKITKVFSAPFKPSTMAFVGENDFLILDRDHGKVFRVIDGKMLQSPLLDEDVATVGYRGMLGIAITSDYNKNKVHVFLYFTQASKDGEDEDNSVPHNKIRNVIYRYELYNNRLLSPKLLLELPAIPGPRHMGGVIGIGPDRNLYISTG